MSSNNILKRYFCRLIDENQPELSESTVCCVKCHQHGKIRRFDASAETLQHDHLFEFHAIIGNQPTEYILGTELLESHHPEDEIVDEDDGEIGQIQYTDEDVVEVEFVQQSIDGEEIIQEANDAKDASIVRHSGVWNYFEENTAEQKVHCLLCRQNNVSHSYSTNSSTSNLRKHLKTAHEIEVENYKPLMRKGKNDEKRGYGISRVWKYFCKVKKNGEIQDKDYVYCAECLKKGTQHRYKQTSSTGTLRQHLRSQHDIDLDVGREYCETAQMVNIENIVAVGLEASPVKMHRKGKTKKLSSARSYYSDVPDDDEYVYCTLCSAENRVHKYRKSTSSSTLKTHLVQKHEIDPDAEEAENSKKNIEEGEILDGTEAVVEVYSFDEEILERAQKITSIKTRKIRTYFFRLEDEEVFCCAFCILDGIKKAYKPTTSTSGLRRHLMSAHQLDPLGYFKSEGDTEVTLNEEQIAESIAGKNKAKESDVWKYFCKKEVMKEDSSFEIDENYIYCSLCWNGPTRQIHKYKTTTSSGALKRHLASRHGLQILNRRVRSMTNTTKTDAEETQEEDHIIEEEEQQQEEVFYEEVEVVSQQKSQNPPTIVRKPQPNPIKLPKYCRSCGKTDAGFFTKLTAVFDDADCNDENPEQISLSELYFQITGIRVRPDDGMSQLVCYLCEANLKSAYKFRKIALETENDMIQKLFGDQTETDDYEVLEEVYLDDEDPPDDKVVYRKVTQHPGKSQKFITVISKRHEKLPEEDQEITLANYETADGQEIEYEEEYSASMSKRKKNEGLMDEMFWDGYEVKNDAAKRQKRISSEKNKVFQTFSHATKQEAACDIDE
ncbi:uncharacterized protein LOC134828095 [Culicoides brevitarsis]|uniref:uncharacterized protein LOC134828095 n=1 Tax=Culicoides brevitarsis TaxID=469753 RepID=UPI00307C566C